MSRRATRAVSCATKRARLSRTRSSRVTSTRSRSRCPNVGLRSIIGSRYAPEDSSPFNRGPERPRRSDMSNKVVLGAPDIARTIVRIAHQIVEQTEGRNIAIVGIHRRGAVLARRLAAQVSELVGQEIPLGELDISFYRDDVAMRDPARQPVVHASKIDFAIDGMTLILVDDVLYTGRTVRSAIDAIFDYGRPKRVQLAVLADRGPRELPIRPDYVGKNLPTGRGERVNVRVEEIDGVDEVTIGQLQEVAA